PQHLDRLNLRESRPAPRVLVVLTPGLVTLGHTILLTGRDEGAASRPPTSCAAVRRNSDTRPRHRHPCSLVAHAADRASARLPPKRDPSYATAGALARLEQYARLHAPSFVACTSTAA